MTLTFEWDVRAPLAGGSEGKRGRRSRRGDTAAALGLCSVKFQQDTVAEVLQLHEGPWNRPPGSTHELARVCSEPSRSNYRSGEWGFRPAVVSMASGPHWPSLFPLRPHPHFLCVGGSFSELKARASLALHPLLGSAALTPLKLPSLIFWNCYRGCAVSLSC